VLSDELKKRLDQLDAKRALEIFIPSHQPPWVWYSNAIAAILCVSKYHVV